MAYYAALDIGGSNARILLAGPDGRPLHEAEGPGATINIVGCEAARALYSPFVLGALAAAGLQPAGCLGLCVAASGVDSPEQAGQIRDIFAEMGFAPVRMRVVNDCEVYLLACDGPAMVLTVGTGSIAVGRNRKGQILRCGGFGHLLSDEGSGFDMGMRVLRLVANHLDGRTPSPALYERFTAQCGLDDPLALNEYAAQHLADKPQIARFAPLLTEAALAGDAAAAAEIEHCIELLSQLAQDLVCKLAPSENEKLPCLFWGSVLVKNASIAEPLRTKLENSLPVQVAYPTKSALQTALDVARAMSA